MRAEEFYHYNYFKTPSPWAEKCLLVSDAMGYTAEPDFRIDRKSFYNYLAFYVYRGTFHVEQYGESHALHQGDVGILNLMDSQVYYPDCELMRFPNSRAIRRPDIWSALPCDQSAPDLLTKIWSGISGALLLFPPCSRRTSKMFFESNDKMRTGTKSAGSCDFFN